MFLIAVYDICTVEKNGQKRLTKLMKLMRQYLHHTQKSVFEGEITEAKFTELRTKAARLIGNNTDYIVFYSISNKNNIKRDTLGNDFNPNDTII